jgi:hypothetical protein
MAGGQRVVDFDDIVEALGVRRYSAPPETLAKAQEMWRASIPSADWVVWTAPKRADRGRFRGQYGARVVVVMASQDECLRRAKAERPPTWEGAILRWFMDWEPSQSGSEMIVRSDR